MNDKAKAPLPEYDRPPVVEVAVSVQFGSPSLSTQNLLSYRDRVRGRFPGTEQLMALPPAIEELGRPSQTGPKVELRFYNAPPPPRLFLVQASGTELIQIQADRFGYNWRRLQPNHAYPRYKSIRASFVDEFAGFLRFLEEQQLGPIRPTQCEVTYVNHMFSGSVWKGHGEAERVLRTIHRLQVPAFLPTPEQTQQNSTYLMAGSEKPLGRLYCNFEPRFLSPDGTPIFSMTLTARGAPAKDGEAGILDMLDTGHEWIVRGFSDLTTPEMQKAWERKR